MDRRKTNSSTVETNKRLATIPCARPSAMARLAYTAVNATDVEEGQGAPDLSHRRPESNRWRKIYCMTIVLVVAFVGLVGYWRSGTSTSSTSPSLSKAVPDRPQLADRLGAERTRLVLKLLGVRHSNDAELLKAVRTLIAGDRELL